MLFFPRRFSPSQRRSIRRFNADLEAAFARVAELMREGVKARLAEPGGEALRWTDAANEYGTRMGTMRRPTR